MGCGFLSDKTKNAVTFVTAFFLLFSQQQNTVYFFSIFTGCREDFDCRNPGMPISSSLFTNFTSGRKHK